MADEVSSMVEMNANHPMKDSAASKQEQNHQIDTEPGLPTAAGPLTSSPPPSSTSSSTTTTTTTTTSKEPSSSFCPPHPAPPAPAVSPPHGLSDQVYLLAAAIFQMLHVDKPITQQLLCYGKKTDTPLPDCRDKTTKRQAYQLAFNTLKYQDLLEDIMIDSCFHTSQQISDDLLPLAMVMLFDFQDRKFLILKHPAQEEEELMQEVRNLESSLYRCKTKLAASLACYRVKHGLLSVSCFLSEPVRTKQHRASLLPIYAWVNTLRSSVEEVCEALRGEGVCEVECVTDLVGSTFCRDPLCSDTLVFPSHLHTLLQHSKLTAEHTLNIQDKSVCMSVSALRPLLLEDSDVLVAGSFSALTVAHIAVLAAACSGRVLVCGSDHTAPQREEMQELLKHINIKNVRVLSEEFCGLNEWDAIVQRLKVIIVLPQCSSSALNDPVDTIITEHGDPLLLQDLSQGSVSQSKIHTLATQQARILAHAFTFPKVQAVVYCTRSVYPEENEQLVKRVLEKAGRHPKLLPFRVSGPVFSEGSGSGPGGDSTTDKFLRIEPSEHTNGCFIALLAREADPPKEETVQDVLARAAAKGLLSGIITDQSKTTTRGRRKKTHPPLTTNESLPTANQEKPVLTKTKPVIGEDPGSGIILTVKLSTLEERGEVEDESIEEKEGVAEGEDEGEKEKEEKRRGFRKSKVKPKQRSRQGHRSSKVRKAQSSHSRNKPTTRRVKLTHHNKHPRRSTRTKPRVQLSSLTPSALSSNHSSLTTALPDTLTPDPPTIMSRQPVSGTGTSPSSKTPSPTHPAPPSLHKSPKQPHKLTQEEPERAGKPYKEVSKPGITYKAMGKVGRPKKEVVMQEVLKPRDFVLPPISSSSLSSLSSRSSSSSLSSPSSRASSSTSRTRLTQSHLPSSLSVSSLDKTKGPDPRPRF